MHVWTDMNPNKLVGELEKIAEVARETCRIEAIFGPPTKLATQTIVPVGAVITAFGGGAGGIALMGGGGIGVNLRVLPLGFISEVDGVARFVPIDLPPQLDVPSRAADSDEPGLLAKLRSRLASRRGERSDGGV